MITMNEPDIKEVTMIRAFETHQIRKRKELSSSLWSFRTLKEGCKDKTIQVMVPGCWETYPDTLTYRGKAVYSKEFEARGNKACTK